MIRSRYLGRVVRFWGVVLRARSSIMHGFHDEAESVESGGSVVLSVVWKAQTLGIAFVEDTVLRFCEVADPAPDFVLLQSCKHTLKPDIIVAPASSDHSWMVALSSSPLLQPGGAAAANDEEEEAEPAEPLAMADGPTVVRAKSRDFNGDAAYKRLSLLRSLSESASGRELSEREALLNLEHILPREQEQARRAVGGLLAYLAREEVGGPLNITELKRYSLAQQLYMAPETFLSLNIFADDRHPSAHGGRAKEGWSVWTVLNQVRGRARRRHRPHDHAHHGMSPVISHASPLRLLSPVSTRRAPSPARGCCAAGSRGRRRTWRCCASGTMPSSSSCTPRARSCCRSCTTRWPS